MESTVTKFANFIGKSTDISISNAAFHSAKLIVADCLGAIIGGMAEPEIRALAESEGANSKNLFQILSTAEKVNDETVSFLFGTAGTVLEMDEGHQFAKGHPGMHVFPALLAAARNSEISGEGFLRAFIIGYDVGARIGLASNLNPNMHPHGTWGGLGAAASLAALHNMDTQQANEYLNIVSSLTLATSRKTMLEGATVRNSYTGVSNKMAHVGLSLLKAGFSGESDGIKSIFDGVVSSRFDSKSAFELIGKRFEVSRNYFKLHACCRYNHAALDALWKIIEQHSEVKNINQIEKIEVQSYNLAAELKDQNPRNVLACKFSVPFAIATTLANLDSGVLSFTENMRTNKNIQNLCQKVTIVEDTNMTGKLPNLRPADVYIQMANGSTFKAQVTTNRGDWQDPYSEEELKQKFISLTTRLWSQKKALNVYSKSMKLEKIPLDDLINSIIN
jgi:2-methylcitrate dehydratase PrpD